MTERKLTQIGGVCETRRLDRRKVKGVGYRFVSRKR